MSVYVVQAGNAQLECDMEYAEGRDVICRLYGVEMSCLEDAVRKTGFQNYIKIEGDRFYISTAIFKAGRTPGELIREIATLLRLCRSENS
ncbi:hypothetical protein [Pyrobaculum neutrophilum]|uniref:hypothetical protein n=1 Tax=Pyrobaculum neutrophilum TaxID=70771 RepID=UPI0003258D40|nr:hypothetical protein [Pyrobaculum neutrophilum]